MKFLIFFPYLALGVHMLDASRHYWREKETFSSVLNFALGTTSLVIGLVLLVMLLLEI